MVKSRRVLFFRPMMIAYGVVIAIAGLVWSMFFVRGAVDQKGFQELMVQVDPTLSPTEPHKSHHLREGICKEVIIVREPMERRARLMGKEAVIVLDRDTHGTEVIENLLEVTAYVQDTLFEREGVKGQIVHKIEADWLSCDYPRDQFIAKNAVIRRLMSAGHELDSDIDGGLPLVVGRAPLVEIHLNSNTIRFRGGVEVENEKGNAFADEMTLIPDQIILRRNVNFTDPLGEVYADYCTIHFAGHPQVMQHIHLEGNIRIVNNPKSDSKGLQYALADRVDYYPESGEMLLYASDEGRVLFFDPSEDFQISAPSIRVQRNRKLKKNKVQGLGDVRLHFAEDEKQQFKKRFL